MSALFKVQRLFLRLGGQTFYEDKSTKSKILYKSTLFCVVTAIFGLSNYIVRNRDDGKIVISSLCLLLTDVITFAKVVTMLVKREAFSEIIEIFEGLFNNVSNPKMKEILKRENDRCDKLVNMYKYACLGTGAGYCMTPFVKSLYFLIRNQGSVRELPIPMDFYFDKESTPNYQFHYAYLVYGIMLSVFYIISSDGLFIAFAFHLRGHFKILSSSLHEDDFWSASEKSKEKFKSFFQYHCQLLDLCERVNQAFGMIILFQFVMMSLQLCLVLYQLLEGADFDQLFTLCLYLSMVIMQVYIYCHGGEMISNASLMVSDAIQASNWYLSPPKYSRLLIIIIMRSQKQAKVRSAIYVASLETFKKIIESAVSYFMLVRSFYSKDA